MRPGAFRPASLFRIDSRACFEATNGNPPSGASFIRSRKMRLIIPARRPSKPALPTAVCAALLFAFSVPARAAETRFLHGHVPSGVARLQPVGRLDRATNLTLAIGLPLRNRDVLTNLFSAPVRKAWYRSVPGPH